MKNVYSEACATLASFKSLTKLTNSRATNDAAKNNATQPEKRVMRQHKF